MISPYINTELLTTVSVHPSQMNNNIEHFIKDNLKRRVTRKCFSHYGFIVQVHEVTQMSDAIIIPEDPTSSAMFEVKFLCTICHPLKNSLVVGVVENIKPMLIKITNGPLEILVNTRSSVNTKVFTFNAKKRVWLIQKIVNGEKKIIVLKPGLNVSVKIINKKIVDKQERIICLGYLEDLASEEDAMTMFKGMSIVKDFDRTNNLIEDIDEYTSKNLIEEEVSEDTAESEDE